MVPVTPRKILKFSCFVCDLKPIAPSLGKRLGESLFCMIYQRHTKLPKTQQNAEDTPNCAAIANLVSRIGYGNSFAD